MAVKIEHGNITINGRLVGRAEQQLKYGYHPCVSVTLYKKAHHSDQNMHKWFEVDTPDLLAKIADYARAEF